jgi:hypothetical protein
MRLSFPVAGFILFAFTASRPQAQPRILPLVVGFLAGSDVLNHRAPVSSGKQGLAARLVESINPMTDPRTRTMGVSVEIPLGQGHRSRSCTPSDTLRSIFNPVPQSPLNIPFRFSYEKGQPEGDSFQHACSSY